MVTEARHAAGKGPFGAGGRKTRPPLAGLMREELKTKGPSFGPQMAAHLVRPLLDAKGALPPGHLDGAPHGPSTKNLVPKPPPVATNVECGSSGG